MNSVFVRRAVTTLKSLVPWLRKIGLTHFYLAGSSLLGANGDVDLFPVTEPTALEGELLSKTKNATTILIAGKIVQICKYHKTSLEELIQSFDFAHTQVGVEVKLEDSIEVTKVFWTPEFAEAQLTGESHYLKSEYPLSSLIRVSKYLKAGRLSRGSSIRSVLNILVDIIERGFKDYEDFKDQLDAIDLGLLPEEMKDVTHARLLELFELLRRDGKAA